MRFGTDLDDAGGVAVAVTARMPTGERDNLRGLGVARTMVSFVGSGKMGRIQPHANAGFEFWSKGVTVVTGGPSSSVQARHQIQVAAGVEVEATPKLTLMLDFIGQQIRGGRAASSRYEDYASCGAIRRSPRRLGKDSKLAVVRD